jgi:3-oxoacyl-[acyl-carrier-protein] synthase-1
MTQRRITPLALTHFTATSCIGTGLAQTLTSLAQQRGGLAPCTFETGILDTHVGEVARVDEQKLPRELSEFDCRNNRLAYLGLQQDGFAAAVAAVAARVGPQRVGVFLGTSTAGILETEFAYRRRDPQTGALPASFHYHGTHNTFSVADFTRRFLGLSGPAAAISCACSSSAKVFGVAERMMAAGLIDAAVVGGVDSLCFTTLYGFHSLQLVSARPCRPFDAARDGISIGEAAAFALLEKIPSSGPAPGTVLLLGVGESSDAWHMSSPHPQGRGAQAAMTQALASAGLRPHEIDYVNLHGTATPSNDSAEGCAVMAVLGSDVPASSTKGATGHTLGAAGALEAVICALTLQRDFLPGGLNTTTIEPGMAINYLLHNQHRRVERVMSNSFGFGGSNCSLIFGRAP